jgi:hypothetical protein
MRDGTTKSRAPSGVDFNKEGGLNIHEKVIVQVIAGSPVNGIPQLQVFLHHIPAQIEIAEFHAQVIAAIRIILDGERRCYDLLRIA